MMDLSEFPDDTVRSLAYYNGKVYAGGRAGASIATLVPVRHLDFIAEPKIDTGGASSVRSIAHGLCFLTGGNFVIGGYNQEITEYSDANTAVATSDSSGVIDINSLSACEEGDNSSELYLIDYDGNADTDGDIVYASKTASSWNEVSRFDLSSNGGGSIYSMVNAILIVLVIA